MRRRGPTSSRPSFGLGVKVARRAASAEERVRYPQADPIASVVQRKGLGPPTRRRRFESGHSLQSVQLPVVAPSIPLWCQRSMPGSYPVRWWFKSTRRDHVRTILKGTWSKGRRHRVVSAEVRVRVPLSSPEWACRSTATKHVAEGRDGDLEGLISPEMPVRSRPPRPTAGSSNGRASLLQSDDEGSIPSPATNLVSGSLGNR
jgi:hypothetical protein